VAYVLSTKAPEGPAAERLTLRGNVVPLSFVCVMISSTVSPLEIERADARIRTADPFITRIGERASDRLEAAS